MYKLTGSALLVALAQKGSVVAAGTHFVARHLLLIRAEAAGVLAFLVVEHVYYVVELGTHLFQSDLADALEMTVYAVLSILKS